MGNAQSNMSAEEIRESAISLENMPDIDGTFHVTRTSGEVETGWVCSKPANSFNTGLANWVNQHALKSNKWKIFLHNQGTTINTYVSGWRNIETIWPSRLDGDRNAILEWRTKLGKALDDIEKSRT
jgi:hypothetical protein